MKKILHVLSKKKDVIIGEAASKESIDLAQQMLGIRFAEEYVEYLLKYGFACYEGHELTGLCKAKRLNVIEVTKKEREDNSGDMQKAYVVEQTHIDGIVIWQTASGEIYQTQPFSAPVKIYDSLYEYVKQESF